jgi:predicted MFS family arabinose efflux permease
MPLMHPERHAASIACLNLGSGLAIAVGPAIVAVFYSTTGVQGVMLIFAGLYLLAFLLTFLLPDRKRELVLRSA